MKKKLLKQDVSIVYNYSDINLTPAMSKLLNRGLNFVIQPKSLDFFDTLSDFRYFERSCLWKEYWHDKEPESESKPSIFKTKKTNYPRKHPTPDALHNSRVLVGMIQ